MEKQQRRWTSEYTDIHTGIMVVAQNERSERKRAADLIWSDHFQHWHYLFWGQRPNLLYILTEYILRLSTQTTSKRWERSLTFYDQGRRAKWCSCSQWWRWVSPCRQDIWDDFSWPKPWKSNLSTGNTQHFIAVGIWDIWNLHQIPQQLCEPRRGAGAWDGVFL